MINIKELINNINEKKYINAQLQLYKNKLNENKLNINKLTNDIEFRQIISDNLENELKKSNTDRLSENNYKKYIEYPMTINGVKIDQTEYIKSAQFYPLIDYWELVDIIEENNKIKVCVECIKNRLSLGSAGGYIIDTFWTNWIEI